jgi:hypothetical protein
MSQPNNSTIHSASTTISPDQAFQLCQQLTKMMVTPQIKSEEVIAFMKTNQVHPNIYLPLLAEEGGGWAPLLYFCCRDIKFINLLSYMVEHGLDLNAQPRECDKAMEILYYCRPEYIPILMKIADHLNQSVILDESSFLEMGKRLLISGGGEKILLLLKWKAISSSQLTDIIQDQSIMFQTIEELYRQIGLICHSYVTRRISDYFYDRNYEKIVKNYLITFALYFKNITVNQIDENGHSLMQRILDTYIIELIEMVFRQCKIDLDGIKVNHFSNFDQTTRQIMSKLYNENNFHRISKLVDAYKMPKKIIVKKMNK